MSKLLDFKCEISPMPIYGREMYETDLPKGYEAEDFRCPKKGECYLTQNAWVALIATRDWTNEPRIILKPKPKRKRYIYEETGEVRVPHKEWAIDPSGDPSYYYLSSVPRSIVRKIIEEVSE